MAEPTAGRRSTTKQRASAPNPNRISANSLPPDPVQRPEQPLRTDLVSLQLSANGPGSPVSPKSKKSVGESGIPAANAALIKGC